MNILFLHPNFPAQFKSIAPFLAFTDKYEVHSLAWKKSHKEDDYLKSINHCFRHPHLFRHYLEFI